MSTDEERLLISIEAKLTKFERDMKRAQKVTTETATGMENRFKRANDAINRSSRGTATGIMQMVTVSRQGRFVLQNTANQIGDIAVQLAAGTAPARAMAQQLPQLLGGFGALGGSVGVLAPLLGTVAAIGIPAAAALFAMARDGKAAADEAETLTQRIENLKRATKDYQSAADETKVSIAELRKEYGDLSDDIALALVAQRELRREQAQAALNRTAAGISGAFGSLDSTVPGDALSTFASDYEKTLRRLRKEFDLTGQEAVQLAQALGDVGNAANPEEQAQAFSALRTVLVEIFGSVQAANEATDGLVDRLNDGIIAAGDLKATTDDLPGGLGAAADEAGRLAGNLQAAADAYLAARVQTGLVPDVALPGGGLPGAPERVLPRFTMPDNPPPRRSGGSNIDAAEAAKMATIKRLYDETRTAAEKYAIELEELNALRDAGDIDNDLYARSLANLDEKFKDVASGAREMENAFRSAFSSLITDAGDAEQAVARLLASLATVYANRAFNNLWGGMGLGNLLSFDGGGFTGMGARAGGIDGKGGFPAILHPNETVIDHTKGGAAGGVTIINQIDARGAVEGVAVQIARELDRRGPAFASAASAARTNALSRGRTG